MLNAFKGIDKLLKRIVSIVTKEMGTYEDVDAPLYRQLDEAWDDCEGLIKKYRRDSKVLQGTLKNILMLVKKSKNFKGKY